ncbi:ribbon-helix-helix protein, CopG family [Mesorhizobium atlanticum]
MSFDTGIEAALAAAAAEMSVGRSEVIRLAVREWLETRQRESDRSAKPDHSGTERADADA